MNTKLHYFEQQNKIRINNKTKHADIKGDDGGGDYYNEGTKYTDKQKAIPLHFFLLGVGVVVGWG